MSYPVLLDAILKPGALRAEFQPVVEIGHGNRVHYLEGLVRGPRGTNVERPDVLFSYARRKHAEVAVDRACLRTVLEAARLLPGTVVSVNVHATTLATDLEFVPFLGDVLSATGIEPERVLLELVENCAQTDLETLLLNLDGLRRIGLRMALDDFGTGSANYMMLLECRPEYLKIDSYFVHGCRWHGGRRAFLDSLAALGRQVGARVVAEGIEDPDDLEQVRAAGIGLAQGFLLGSPRPA